MPFDQIFRESIPQRERAVKKKPRPVWGYRPGLTSDASGWLIAGVCQDAG